MIRERLRDAAIRFSFLPVQVRANCSEEIDIAVHAVIDEHAGPARKHALIFAS